VALNGHRGTQQERKKETARKKKQRRQKKGKEKKNAKRNASHFFFFCALAGAVLLRTGTEYGAQDGIDGRNAPKHKEGPT
jgi:hypothetical protein